MLRLHAGQYARLLVEKGRCVGDLYLTASATL
jgi:hypothetical protein